MQEIINIARQSKHTMIGIIIGNFKEQLDHIESIELQIILVYIH